MPKARAPRVEMYPYSEAELEAFYRRAADRNQRLADLVLIDGRTGLRWSELRAVGVRNFIEVPRTGRAAVPDRDRTPAAPRKRTLAWTITSESRRIHDLRHTAAWFCWLAGWTWSLGRPPGWGTRHVDAWDLPGYLERVARDQRRGKESDRKGRYHEGLPGYHDPTAGIGGAAPATSALTLRLWLAVFGFVICTAFAIWLYVIDAPIGFMVVLLAMSAVAVIDIAVILRRKRRGEPG